MRLRSFDVVDDAFQSLGRSPAPAFQDHADYPQTAYCDDAYAFVALDFVRTQGQNYNKSGKPQLSWIARIENTGGQSSGAHAGADLEVLALEVRGNASRNAEQALVLGPKVNLMGRNEIRMVSHATLSVDGGTISSLRWVDIHSGATLAGHGSVDAVVYNNGSVEVTRAGQRGLRVTGDYHQAAAGKLSLTMIDNGTSSLQVTGEAKLSGVLGVMIPEGFKPAHGKSFVVLTANEIAGRFGNTDGEVVAGDGSRFTISYSKSAVTLTVK